MDPQQPPATGTSRLTTPTIALMALAAGLCAGGNYFNQPLLDSIAETLSVAPATAAVSVTVAQVAYGAGLLLLVPLGDVLDRRKLAVGLMLLAAAGQALSGWSPNIAAFLTGTAVAGAFSVAAQVLVPFAAALADPARSGRAVGTMMSGLLVGILTARSAAGLVSTLGGWTTIYRIAAVLMLVVALALWRVLPADPPAQRTRVGYGEALRSLGTLIARYPRLRTRAVLGATTFAAVSAVFATMALLLAAEPFGYSPATIGLIGLSGVVGAVAASAVGRLADRGLAQWASCGGLLLLSACWPLFGLPGAHSVAWFVVSFALADLALQAVHISNQNIVFALDPPARSRMNSVYMTAYFIGAAAGSAVGTAAWRAGGWTAVCAAGGALSAVSLVVWAVDLHAARRAAAAATARTP